MTARDRRLADASAGSSQEEQPLTMPTSAQQPASALAELVNGDATLSIAKADPEPRDVFAMAEEHGVKMVDLKFTDLPGTWQHLGLPIRALEEDAFSDGLGFDGSSIRGFQEIAESDMLLVPDPRTSVIDPFHETK